MTVHNELQHLNLIDLLSERHRFVRTIGEKAWNDQHSIQISNAEWTILAHVYKQEPTIASIRRKVNISRQAIHKHIRNLAAKGLVEIHDAEHNKKEKYVRFTTLGEKCYEKNMDIRTNLEEQIGASIGHENVELLKNILKLDWGMKQNIN